MGILGSIAGRAVAFGRTRDVTVAVAGLSRSGKTAFITAVLANLEAAGQSETGRRWLRGLAVVDEGRLRSAARPPAFRARQGRPFPFREALAALSGAAPRWPARTANVYEAAIEIHFWPGERPAHAETPAARLRLALVDYPGEWLVDVPLVRQDFAGWSDATLARLDSGPWQAASAEFRALLAATDWSAPDGNEAARAAALAWQAALVRARAAGLKWLQPGQFLRRRDQPDEATAPVLDEQALWFCPLPRAAIVAAGRGSLAAAMAGRFEGYRAGARRFLAATLRDASRHVLLVDVLEALAEGEHAFHETAELLAATYQALADSQGGFLRRLLGRGGFDRVLVLATKADAVPPDARPALNALLADMCAGHLAGAARIAPPAVDHVAAIRATEEVTVATEAGPVRAVQGFSAAAGRRLRVTRMDLPAGVPDAAVFARHSGARPPRFDPPAIEAGGRLGVPNLRLGAALDRLLGDLLR